MVARYVVFYKGKQPQSERYLNNQSCSDLESDLFRNKVNIEQIVFTDVPYRDAHRKRIDKIFHALQKNTTVKSIKFVDCRFEDKNDCLALIRSVVDIPEDTIKAMLSTFTDYPNAIAGLRKKRNQTLREIIVDGEKVIFLGLEANKILASLGARPNYYHVALRLILFQAAALIRVGRFLDALPYLEKVSSKLFKFLNVKKLNRQVALMVDDMTLCVIQLGDWYRENNDWNNAHKWYQYALTLNQNAFKLDDLTRRNLLAFTARLAETANNLAEFEPLSRAISVTLENGFAKELDCDKYAKLALKYFCGIQQKIERDYYHAATSAFLLANSDPVFRFIYRAVFGPPSALNIPLELKEMIKVLRNHDSPAISFYFVAFMKFALAEYKLDSFPHSPIQAFLQNPNGKKYLLSVLHALSNTKNYLTNTYTLFSHGTLTMVSSHPINIGLDANDPSESENEGEKEYGLRSF